MGLRMGVLGLLRRLLVPVDYSDCSREALQYAIALAKQFDCRVTLLGVDPDEHTAFEYGELDAIMTEARRKEKLLRYLSDMAVDKLGGVSHDVFVKHGKPWEEIVMTARDLGVDMIIMATHGYPEVTKKEEGSTAERVVRHATCPVLVVRPVEHD